MAGVLIRGFGEDSFFHRQDAIMFVIQGTNGSQLLEAQGSLRQKLESSGTTQNPQDSPSPYKEKYN